MLARVLESISFLRKWERTKAAAEVPIWNQKQKVVPGKLVPLRYSQYLLSVHIARIVSSVRIRDSKFNYFKVTKKRHKWHLNSTEDYVSSKWYHYYYYYTSELVFRTRA
jgi:hypothetical protein